MSATDDFSAASAVQEGREALGAGRWEDARRLFEAAVAVDGNADAMEGLAMSAWWLDDAPVVIDMRERAYRLRRECGDGAGAARLAIGLAWDYLTFRGEPAVANGWLERARSLLDGLDPVPEHGWLAIRRGEIAFVLDNDVAGACTLARQARAVAQVVGDADVELSALALEGMALASVGQIGEGTRMLDEASAAAMAGEISELWAVGRACCYVITACERTLDFERAAQWCERMLDFAKQWRVPHLFAVCRAHYAAVLVWRGTWAEAEAEFEAAMREFSRSRPGMGFEAVVRLAELRRRQGRLDEATTLYREVEFHPFAQLGLAAVALDSGDPATAVDLAERFLRRLGAANPLQRLGGLQLLIRARVALGETERARADLPELRALAAEIRTDPLRAWAFVAEGTVDAADGDHEAARCCFEDAVDLFQRSGAPFETAQARMELAVALAALGRHEAARRQASAASEALLAIRAEGAAGRAAALLAELAEPDGDAVAASELTARELEVLRLVAQGMTNAAIAERLVVSEHTVHRHLANIMAKLRLNSRAAAAVWAAQHRLV